MFHSTFNASTYWLYNSRSSFVFTAFFLKAFHILSSVVNQSDPRRNPHRHPTLDASITHAYLIQFQSHTRVCLYCIFASIVAFTICGAWLANSTSFLNPGSIPSSWFNVSSFHFNILFFALSFRVRSLPSNSDSTSRFSDKSAYPWSILRRTSDSHCCSRNSFHLSYNVFFIAFGKSPETSRSHFDVKLVLILCASLSDIHDFSVMISIMDSRYFTTALSLAFNTLQSFATTALLGFPLSSNRSTYSSQFSSRSLWKGSLSRKSLDFIVFFVDNASYSCPIAFFSCWILSTYFCIFVSPSERMSLCIESLLGISCS